MTLPEHPPSLKTFKGVNYRKLEAILTMDHGKFVQLLKDCKLLCSERMCSACGLVCKQVPKACWAGYQWECSDRKCRKRIAATDSSFFSRAKLNPLEIMRLAYYFSQGEYKYSKLKHELKRDDGTSWSDHTISDWICFLREVCAAAVDREPIQIGGPGKIVEIDETCLVKHKHHRGVRYAKPTWVFGGIERGDKTKMFCVIVARRNKETLEPLIEKFIAPNTEIISDGWAAYCDIPKLNGNYTHQVVNHSKNFKDPVTGAHTNGIEGEWMHFKKPQKAANTQKRKAHESSQETRSTVHHHRPGPTINTRLNHTSITHLTDLT